MERDPLALLPYRRMHSAQGDREGQKQLQLEPQSYSWLAFAIWKQKSELESDSGFNSACKGWEDAFQSESEIINQSDIGKRF